MFDFDINKILSLFQYDPKSPMIFSSGFFLFLFLAFILLYVPLQGNKKARMIYVTLFSYFFYYKSSGIYFILLFIATICDYILANQIYKSEGKTRRKLLLVLSLSFNLGILCYFKYTNFFYQLWCDLVQAPFNPLNIFLPVGISFFTFQSMSYTIEIYRKDIKPVKKFLDYAFFVSFFPQLVAGPIVRAKDFLPQIERPLIITQEMFGRGIFLIITGLFKKAIISDYISTNFVDRIFDNPSLYSGLENLFGIYGYALQIYCDFSGYSDMAIGIALLLGIRFNVNFDSPYQSATITEFWRRWHISLSSWLKDYLYISLGGNRKGKLRTYLNLIITMLLGGLWHGASLRFVFWGAIHGVSLAVHKLVMNHFSSFKKEGAEMNPFRRVLGVIVTFHLVCFGWIFFRADSMAVGLDVLKQIFTDFHPEIFLQFVVGYDKVFILLLIGYIAHFIPKRVENRMQQFVIDSPMLLQAFYLILVIFIVTQVKSSGIVPFIYFQF